MTKPFKVTSDAAGEIQRSKRVQNRGTALSWAAELLVCPRCKEGGIAFSASAGECRNCHAILPIRNSVPLLLNPDAYLDVAATLSPHMQSAEPGAIEIALGSALRFQLQDREKRAEFSNIIDRYPGVLNAISAVPQTSTVSTARQPPFTLVSSYFEPVFVPSSKRYRSLRIRNNTSRIIASTGDHPFSLSYWLYHGDLQICGNGIRSRLPIPLLPGAEQTVPVQIQAPDEPGHYRIVVLMVEEYVRWYESSPLLIAELHVTADPQPWADLTSQQVDQLTKPFDLRQDIVNAGLCYAEAVQAIRVADNGDTPIVLELACGSRPQALLHFQRGTRVVASDLCFPQVQLGCLEFVRALPDARDSFLFCCGDVYNPPFTDSSFDIVMICAALHHFSNIVDALRLVARLLKPDGKLVLLREPCFVNAADLNYLRELQNGFNEQQFEIEEYFWMLKQSGFILDSARVDFGGSLKLIAAKLPLDRTDGPSVG
jgi:SAM-dependent methyltransferase/uncharacterized protein YbaR (Trm112 family)